MDSHQDSDIAERWRRFGQDDHVRQYSKQGFIDRIIEAGFDLDLLGIEEFSIQEFVKHGITQQSVLYIVKKPLK
jgi:predicted Ser/Thr protein kinase